MRGVVQRVSEASVFVGGARVAAIGRGLLVLVGVGRGDTQADVDLVADKIVNLRVFPDEKGQMNQSLGEVGGELLVVSQFTLLGDCRKGRRPRYADAAPPEEAPVDGPPAPHRSAGAGGRVSGTDAGSTRERRSRHPPPR